MPQRLKPTVAALSLLLPLTSLAGAKGAVPPAPVAAKKAVVDTYHGTKVDDPYQWLEKSDDPEVRKWVEGQTAHMRAVVDSLPSRDAIRARITSLLTHKSAAHFAMIQRGGVLFAMKFQPPRQQPMLVVLPSVDDPSTARVLVDPMELDPSGHTTLDFFVPSLDGRRGKALGGVPTPPVSSVGGTVDLGGDDLLLGTNSYTEASAVYRYTAKDGTLTKTALGRTSPVDTRDVVVDRVMCTSKDGTQVPLNILHAQGSKRNGDTPTLLTGYGGFNVSLSPGFNPMNFAFIEQGGVVAIANLRGGSEFGEAWHANGSLTKKQNVFDDFYACAKLLVDQKWTRPERLAIQGGSNGGLLMGAALTQHPEMYRTVLAHVGIYDMLRVELTPNGQFNVTEYGTVKNPEQFQAMYGYSPYHHVKNGVKYPSVFFTSGENDPRVDPFHSRKMVARLQEATGSKRPVLLRTNNMGHGGGTPLGQRIEELVDVYSFLFNELGMKYISVE